MATLNINIKKPKNYACPIKDYCNLLKSLTNLNDFYNKIYNINHSLYIIDILKQDREDLKISIIGEYDLLKIICDKSKYLYFTKIVTGKNLYGRCYLWFKRKMLKKVFFYKNEEMLIANYIYNLWNIFNLFIEKENIELKFKID